MTLVCIEEITNRLEIDTVFHTYERCTITTTGQLGIIVNSASEYGRRLYFVVLDGKHDEPFADTFPQDYVKILRDENPRCADRILADARAYAALGLPKPVLTREEKIQQYGDIRLDTPEYKAEREAHARVLLKETVRDLNSRGVKLPKDMRRQAREAGINLKLGAGE